MQEGSDDDCERRQDDCPPEDDELRLKDVAAQVVQDVLRQAPMTAMERVSAQCVNTYNFGEGFREEDEDELPPFPSPENIPNFTSHKKYVNRDLQRLPTIQIDTVASAPGSPTEWPSPPPEAAIREEDEEDHIELAFDIRRHDQSEDIHEYAASYLDDLMDRAVGLAEERKKAQDEEQAREIAAKVVDDVISQASESASRKSGTMSGQRVKYKDAPKQLQEFAKSYIKDVIARAVTAAEEKAIHNLPFSFDDMDIIKTNGPWYIRVREAFMRVLRTACFCAPRRNDS